jgi:hypothetical protein
VHAVHAPESSEHWKLEPLSLELKSKLALVEVVVPDGPEEIVVSGAVLSTGGAGAATVQLRLAGEVSVLPAASVARTAKVWDPTATMRASGGAQVPQAPESSEHWKLEPLSLEVKAKLTLVRVVVPKGPETILVWGAAVSAGGCGGSSGAGAFAACASSSEIGMGAGGPRGALAGSRGLVPACTSAPSPKPSPSVSNRFGLVRVRRLSVRVLTPSRSGSRSRTRVTTRFFTTWAEVTPFAESWG